MLADDAGQETAALLLRDPGGPTARWSGAGRRLRRRGWRRHVEVQPVAGGVGAVALLDVDVPVVGREDARCSAAGWLDLPGAVGRRRESRLSGTSIRSGASGGVGRAHQVVPAVGVAGVDRGTLRRAAWRAPASRPGWRRRSGRRASSSSTCCSGRFVTGAPRRARRRRGRRRQRVGGGAPGAGVAGRRCAARPGAGGGGLAPGKNFVQSDQDPDAEADRDDDSLFHDFSTVRLPR